MYTPLELLYSQHVHINSQHKVLRYCKNKSHQHFPISHTDKTLGSNFWDVRMVDIKSGIYRANVNLHHIVNLVIIYIQKHILVTRAPLIENRLAFYIFFPLAEEPLSFLK